MQDVKCHLWVSLGCSVSSRSGDIRQTPSRSFTYGPDLKAICRSDVRKIRGSIVQSYSEEERTLQGRSVYVAGIPVRSAVEILLERVKHILNSCIELQ